MTPVKYLVIMMAMMNTSVMLGVCSTLSSLSLSLSIYIYISMYDIYIYIWRRIWQPTPVFLPGESPWTEEPGELRYMGPQRVGHD